MSLVSSENEIAMTDKNLVNFKQDHLPSVLITTLIATAGYTLQPLVRQDPSDPVNLTPLL
jgi:hypothetical protein